MSFPLGIEASAGLPQPEGPQVYTVAGLAALWGVSDQFIYDEIRRGRLKAMRFGGKLLRIRREAVEEYEEQASLAALDNPPTAQAAGSEVFPPQPSYRTAEEAAHDMRLERRTRSLNW